MDSYRDRLTSKCESVPIRVHAIADSKQRSLREVSTLLSSGASVEERTPNQRQDSRVTLCLQLETPDSFDQTSPRPHRASLPPTKQWDRTFWHGFSVQPCSLQPLIGVNDPLTFSGATSSGPHFNVSSTEEVHIRVLLFYILLSTSPLIHR